jgi:hypothetical protein
MTSGSITLYRTEETDKIQKGIIAEFGYFGEIKEYLITDVLTGEETVTIYFEGIFDGNQNRQTSQTTSA